MSSPILGPERRKLLVGIGNELRGDDGAGPEVVRRVAARQREGEGWRTLSVHGLTPELVDDLALAEHVVFVDASAHPLTAPRRSVLEPSAIHESLLGHALSPVVLLKLCLVLHGRAPAAELIEIPARCFDLGAVLSEATAAAVATVSEELVAWRIPRSGALRAG